MSANGRPRIPEGEVTCGIVSMDYRGSPRWKAWVRRNRVIGWGTVLRVEADALKQADDARTGVLKGHDVPKGMRIALGLCISCGEASLPGHQRCAVHREEDRIRQEERRRRAGELPKDEYLASVQDPEELERKKETRDLLEEKLTAMGRCPCGLLLPCFAPHGIIAYAVSRIDAA